MSGRIRISSRRAVSAWNIKNPAATRKIVTPLLPLRKNGRTQVWESIQSTGHSCQPWERTTRTIATPRSPSYRSMRRGSDMRGTVVRGPRTLANALLR